MLSFMINLFPNLTVWLFLLSFLFLWAALKQRKKTLKWGILFLAVWWVICTRPVAESLLRPLETFYVPPKIAELKETKISQVVVLTGGGYHTRDEMLSSAFPHASMYRFTGGLELCRRLGPDCRIIFSGSAGRNQRDLPTAVYMKDLALLFNPALHTSAEAISNSTAEHPANMLNLVENKPFVLVTSAYHMPRSMRAFLKAGLKPIPYPVDFLVQSHYGWNDLLPSAESLWKIQIALHEYIGLLYYKLKGYI